jgi:hypothetical protein
MQVDEGIVHKLGLPYSAFFFKMQSFGYRLAFNIGCSASDLNPVQSKVGKAITNKEPAAAGDNAPALVLFIQPIAYGSGFIQQIDMVQSYPAGHNMLHHDHKAGFGPFCMALFGMMNKFPEVFDGA